MENDQNTTRKCRNEDQHLQVFFDGIPFRIDTEQQLLINLENAGLSCPFSWLEKQGSFYRGLFHRLNDCFVRKGEFIAGDPRLMRILIPEKLIENPFAICPEYIEQINEDSYKGNWKCLLLSAAIKTRLDGVFPELNIAGTVFLVDGRSRLLTEKANRRNAYLLSDNPENLPYCLFFDWITKQIYPERPAGTKDNELVTVKFPTLNEMDPVGSSDWRGLGKTRLLTFYPVGLYYQAEVQEKRRVIQL